MAIFDLPDSEDAGNFIMTRLRYRGANFVLNKEGFDYEGKAPATGNAASPFVFYVYVDDVDFVAFRFHLYAHHPELVRLMSWQRLEPQSQSLAGVTHKNLVGLDEHILSLQKAGEIREDLKPEVITYLIISLSSNGFIDKASFLESEKGQAQYQKLIIESLTTILSTKR